MASIMMSISMRLSLTGAQVDWTIKTSEPRTVSLMETEISPSLKVRTSEFESLSPSESAMLLATGRLEFAEKILMSFP